MPLPQQQPAASLKGWLQMLLPRLSLLSRPCLLAKVLWLRLALTDALRDSRLLQLGTRQYQSVPYPKAQP
jgi:hypothetical protein